MKLLFMLYQSLFLFLFIVMPRSKLTRHRHLLIAIARLLTFQICDNVKNKKAAL